MLKNIKSAVTDFYCKVWTQIMNSNYATKLLQFNEAYLKVEVLLQFYWYITQGEGLPGIQIYICAMWM